MAVSHVLPVRTLAPSRARLIQVRPGRVFSSSTLLLQSSLQALLQPSGEWLSA
jgi:hypothetical protein